MKANLVVKNNFPVASTVNDEFPLQSCSINKKDNTWWFNINSRSVLAELKEGTEVLGSIIHGKFYILSLPITENQQHA